MFARAFGVATLTLLAASAGHANKPLIGVACGDGFYVRAPTQKIYWIHGDPLEKTVTYDGPDKLIALAECGTGTVAVFQHLNGARVFHSGNCLNIGAETGDTALVLDTPDTVTALNVDDGRLSIRLASGGSHDAAICHQP